MTKKRALHKNYKRDEAQLLYENIDENLILLNFRTIRVDSVFISHILLKKKFFFFDNNQGGLIIVNGLINAGSNFSTNHLAIFIFSKELLVNAIF